MRIHVRLSGLLEGFPATDGPTVIETADVLTVQALLQRLRVGAGAGPLLVIVNDTVVPPSERGRHTLAEGDAVVVVPPMKGG